MTCGNDSSVNKIQNRMNHRKEHKEAHINRKEENISCGCGRPLLEQARWTLDKRRSSRFFQRITSYDICSNHACYCIRFLSKQQYSKNLTRKPGLFFSAATAHVTATRCCCAEILEEHQMVFCVSKVDASLGKLVTLLLLLPEMCYRFFNCSQDN